MKKAMIAIGFLIGLQAPLVAQKLTFSEYSKKDTRDIYFEILGKFDSSYIIYKNVRQKHMLTKYDENMHIVKNIPIDFIPDRTFNIDFIPYRDYCYMIYQYQRNNIVYCKALKIDINGNKLDEPRELDTTKISVLADNKIYTTVYSEDRQRILIYKRQLKSDVLTLATKLYDADLKILDSTRQIADFDDNKEVYSDLSVDNNGFFLFAKETGRSRKIKTTGLEVIVHKPGADSFRNYKLSLGSKFIEEVVIKVDNRNRHYIINSFYYGQRKGNIEGLFTSLIDMNGEKPIQATFNAFSDSLRTRMNAGEQGRFVFDNLVIRNTIVKKNGGFILTAEDYYTESLFNNNWNRQYYTNTLPYISSYDYYLASPYYYGYRPSSRNYGREESYRYYYNDVVVLSLDSSLKLEWNSIIQKKQYDVDNDNFLSFSNMNEGGEIHFLFLDKDRKKQLVSNQSILPDGAIKRYPTLKSNDVGYGFMPRLAKQVGSREMIMPYIYLNYVAFAKIEFN